MLKNKLTSNLNRNINYFNFKKVDNKYLLTNDAGKFIFLNVDDFEKFIFDKYNKNSDLYNKLSNNKFIIDKNKELFIEDFASEIRENKDYLFQGTQLHIFVLTKKCNHQCIYCQASANKDKNQESDDLQMDLATAKKAVDIAFQSPDKTMTFEFQGGEPLLNFKTLKFIVNYTKKKNVEFQKNVDFTVVTNLTVFKEEIFDFLINNEVTISTSIDGPDFLHNKNRPNKFKNSFSIIENNLEKIENIFLKKSKKNKISAIQTTTKASLEYPVEIIDQYLALNFNSIFLRPLTPLGSCKDNWNEIGYKAEEFVDFYQTALNYIIKLNLEGVKIIESHAAIFLKKILTNESVNYMELRSPCGGSIGQLAYNYDGAVYVCDEARMLSEMGDENFKLGSVFNASYKSLLDNSICKSVCIASTLEIIPGCADCVYSPYCGSCPVLNYSSQKSIFAKAPSNYKCKIYSGILDIIFDKLKANNEEVKDVFLDWIG